MPPNVKITREEIVTAATELCRKYGDGVINARNVAKELGCSTQPIFSNFQNMEELRREVIGKADEIYHEYTEREINSGKYPVYKATGMAYIRFAKEEKELFKLLFMRDRSSEESNNFGLVNNLPEIVQNSTGLKDDAASQFHLIMWIHVHGIATMIATDYLDLDWPLIEQMSSNVYQGMKTQYADKM